MAWREDYLDAILVPCGVLVTVVYNVRLFRQVHSAPEATFVGVNHMMRRAWLEAVMKDPKGNGVAAVQTIRNTIMGSSLLASTAITVSSVIGTLVAGRNSSSNFNTSLIFGSHNPKVVTVKYIAIVICFLIAFVCHVQSIRYFTQLSFLICTPGIKAPGLTIEFLNRLIIRGTNFFALGTRSYYFCFPLLLWLFGPIPMFVTSVVMVALLMVIDTPEDFQLHSPSSEVTDVEAAHGSNQNPKP